MRQRGLPGIHIVLDKFGTGYSVLSYLHRFPLDSLKIDRSLVARMVEDDGIVQAIVTLGRNLDLKLIAEKVEKAEQSAKRRGLGCELAQGHHFSVPVHAQEATDLLSTQKRRATQRRNTKLAPNICDSSPALLRFIENGTDHQG